MKTGLILMHELTMVNLNPETRLSLIAKIGDLHNQSAWNEFVEIYQPVIHRFVQRSGLQHADAADITQEVLLRVAKSIESWDGNQKTRTFRGWLYRITRNQTIDYLRKVESEKRRGPYQTGEWEQVAEPTEHELSDFRIEYERQVFCWAAEQVKPQFKPTNWQAFWLSTVDGIAVEKVAQILQIDTATVYVARSRITAKIAKLVQAHCEASPNEYGEPKCDK